jgi:hypothetical protein
MKKRAFISLFVISLFLIVSCEKEKPLNACNSYNAVKELPWLKKITDEMDEYGYIKITKLNGNTVFITENCNPSANYISVVYDCVGSRVGFTYQLEKHFSEMKIAWSHKESKCVFR